MPRMRIRNGSQRAATSAGARSTTAGALIILQRENDVGQKIVEHQDGHEAADDRARGADTDALGAALGVVPLVAGDERQRAAEDERLGEALHDVAGVDDPARVLDEGAAVDVLDEDGDAVATGHADADEQERQHRHHDERAEDSRRDQVLHRVHRQRRKRVDLLGDAHRAELGSHAGAGAGGDDDGGKNRGQLAGQRQAERGADEALGAELASAATSCSAKTMPTKVPTIPTIKSDCTPMNSSASKNTPTRNGRRISQNVA